MTANRLIDLLETQKMRLTQYFDENDPYECSLALLPIEREKEQAVKDNNEAERIQLEVSFKNKYFQFGIISLTENFNNILMWTHYADNHRGVVVGFNTYNEFFNSKEKFYEIGNYSTKEHDMNSEGFGTVKKINYTTKRKSISFGEHYSLDDILFTKSIHWSYEGEYRILKSIYNMKPSRTLQSGEEIYLADVPKSCIREIIFGLRCDQGIINETKNKLKRDFTNDIDLFKANLAHLTYDITLEQLNFA